MSPPASGVAVELQGVVKRYPDGTVALAGVDLAVPRGQTFALVGESGSGKTTLLRLLNRTEEPTEGEVWIGGEPAAGLDPVALRRRIGYVPQDGGLLPHWTVARNVELVPRLLGWDEERRWRRSREVLELVHLEPERFAPRYPVELSGGERQRVALARALAAEPTLVLLDEPFGALDAVTRRHLQDQVAELADTVDTTLLLITHDLEEAFLLADRVGVLKNGQLLQVGPPAEIADAPAHPYVQELVSARSRPSLSPS